MSNKSIIIIGAGLAGLSAAHEFKKAGIDAIVLEARNRVGGRVFSMRDFSNGLVAEGGGEFIDEHHTRMHQLAKEFNLTLSKVGSWQGANGDWAAYENKAGFVSDSNVWGINLEFEYQKIWGAVADLGKEVLEPHHPTRAMNAKKLDEQSTLQWLDAQQFHSLARKMFITHIRSEYTCEPENFSLLDLARNSSMYYANAAKFPVTYRVMGGNDLIPQAIAKTLADVRLNAVVTSIKFLESQVEVNYKQNDSFQTLVSDFVILALPLTAAQQINFNDSLPLAHKKMIHEVSYGAVTKVLIEYRKRFWLEKGWSGRLFTDLPIGLTWDATSHLENEHGIITAYTGGKPAEILSDLSDAERTKTAIDVIEKIFPNSSNLIEQTKTIAWRNEPFTRASYMALAPNQVMEHWQTLFTPAGRLYFAGEHATPIQGYMEGAVESGQRVAKEIMIKLQEQK